MAKRPKNCSYKTALLHQEFAIFAALSTFRVINSLIVVTYFNPDEYWQSIEVAHSIVFGTGHRTWEWQPDAQIRSYLHPGTFAIVYKALQLVGADSRWWVAFGPRILQGVFAAVCDLHVYKISCLLFGARSAVVVLFVQVISWFHFYCLVRTFSNSLETTLTAVALYYWVRASLNVRCSFRTAWWWVGAAVALRTQAIVPWSALYALSLRQMARSPGGTHRVVHSVCVQVLPVIAFYLAVSLAVDRFFYGEWTLTMWNFFYVNCMRDISRFYGAHHPLWYFYEGVPVVVASWLPWLVMAVVQPDPDTRGVARHMLWSAAFAVLMLSLVPHKEYRFLLPLMPLVVPAIGHAIARSLRTVRTPRLLLAVLFVLNAAPALYLSRWHQRGPMEVMDVLAERISKEHSGHRVSVDFLMGCHATPFYTHLHLDPLPKLRFLDCTPPSEVPVDDANITESRWFELDPEAFVSRRYHCDTAACPDVIVIFSAQAARAQSALKRLRYRQVASVFHTHIAGDMHAQTELSPQILIFQLTNQSAGPDAIGMNKVTVE